MYFENDVMFIIGIFFKVGFNVNFGIYFYWCLGNINKCFDGIIVLFFIKLKKVDEILLEGVIIIFGGYFFFFEGFYFL